MNETTDLLTTGEAAKRLRVSHRTLTSMCERGGAPPYFLVGKQKRFPADQLSDWIREQAKMPKSG